MNSKITNEYMGKERLRRSQSIRYLEEHDIDTSRTQPHATGGPEQPSLQTRITESDAVCKQLGEYRVIRNGGLRGLGKGLLV
ncbi:MAG: hypothetical protein LQ348_005063 [Seirophora lacunosa]|nr:MAG: hypothetical protein LQ348_005063 [Seirophora lacunosa]